MILYRCDACGEEFHESKGMINGKYSGSLPNVTFLELEEYPKAGTIKKVFSVRKSITIYDVVLDESHRHKQEVVVNKDLCESCVKKLDGGLYAQKV